MNRVRNRLAALAAVVVGAAAIGGCGRDDADLINGKTEFVNKCGACHVLARANTKGTQGPNLDHAFIAARTRGFNSRTIKGIVHRQIAYPLRGSIMPAKLVKGDDADDVAAYVAYAAGVPGKDQGELATAGAAKTSNKPIAAKGGTLTIQAIDGTAFQSTGATAPAGSLKIVMPNKSALPHNIAIKGGPAGKVVNQGASSELTLDAKPGKYTFFCAVPGHEQAGMKGTLTVK